MPQSSAVVYSSLTFATCLLCIVTTILHIIAFATPYWIESDGNSPFLHLGLHEVCFSNCHYPYCPGGDPDINYDGCYTWIFNEQRNDYNWQELANWLLPGWFNTTVNILGANIAVMVICCVFLIVCSCFALANRYTPKSTVKKDRAAVALLYTSLFLLVLSSLLNVSGIAIFSCNGPRRDYMPMSYRNHFGFSFWIDLAVCVLLGGCSFTVFLAAIGKTIHMQGPDDPRYSEDMMLGRI
jgi:hypothetical protein